MARLRVLHHGTEMKVLELNSGREYTFGRGAGCDVQLEEEAGISRQHFRLFDNNFLWTIEVTAKFGEVRHNGQPVQSVELTEGTVFKVGSYDFYFHESAESQTIDLKNSIVPYQANQGDSYAASSDANVDGAADAPGSQRQPPTPAASTFENAEFEGNDEATRIAPAVAGTPVLRLVLPSGQEDVFPLKGRHWIAGREEGCDILLDDRKASRRQFELRRTKHDLFITDLGSSNGSLLNGVSLAGKEPQALKSGDVIQVGSLTIHFEIRDPNYEKKLMVISPEVMALPSIAENPYEFINYPMPTGPGGAVRVESYNGDAPDSTDSGKQKKKRFLLIVAAILIPLVAYLSTMDDSKKDAKSKVTADPFTKLAPNKQQMIRETFALAHNLFLNGKCNLAMDQIRKIHELLPEGFQNSMAIAEECKEADIQAKRLEEIRREQERVGENKRTVELNIKDCTKLAAYTYDLDALKGCLDPTYQLDPENALAAEMEMLVKQRIDLREMTIAKQREYTSRVNAGRALHTLAVNLEKKNDRFGAIEAYKKHIATTLPDPGKLKAQSQSNLDALIKRIENKVANHVASAEAAYSAQNYSEAISQIQAAKQVDPNNLRAAELNAKIRRELNQKLRDIYDEAIIAEGLGQTPVAQTLWKKIMTIDHPSGDYYKKAKNKMRSYGNFGGG